jgi:hypothetical protein
MRRRAATVVWRKSRRALLLTLSLLPLAVADLHSIVFHARAVGGPTASVDGELETGAHGPGGHVHQADCLVCLKQASGRGLAAAQASVAGPLAPIALLALPDRLELASREALPASARAPPV